MKECPYCGKPVPDASRFCGGCGQPADSAAVPEGVREVIEREATWRVFRAFMKLLLVGAIIVLFLFAIRHR